MMKKRFLLSIATFLFFSLNAQQTIRKAHYGFVVGLDAFPFTQYKKTEKIDKYSYKTYNKQQFIAGFSMSHRLSDKFLLMNDLLFSQKIYPALLEYFDGYALRDSLGNIYAYREYVNIGSLKLQNVELDTRLQYEMPKYFVNIGIANFFPIISRIKAAVPNPEWGTNLGYFPDDRFRLYQTLNAGIGKNFVFKQQTLALCLNAKYQIRKFYYDADYRYRVNSIGISLKILL